MKFNYNYAIAKITSDGRIVYKAYKTGYGVHWIEDINDKYVIWYENEEVAKQNCKEYFECLISRCLD